MAPGTTIFDVASGTRTLAGADAVAGNGVLGKSGAGTLAVTGANTNFTGGISVTGGLVNFAAANNLGSGHDHAERRRPAMGDGQHDRHVRAPRGARHLGRHPRHQRQQRRLRHRPQRRRRRLIKAGTGTLTRPATSSYSGGTTVTGGTLQLGVANALNTGGALAVNGGAVDTTDRSQTVGALSGTGGTIALGTGTLTTNSASNTELGEHRQRDRRQPGQAGHRHADAQRRQRLHRRHDGAAAAWSTSRRPTTSARPARSRWNGGGLQWATGTTTDISSRLADLGGGGGTLDTNGNSVTMATAIGGGGG